MSYQKAEDILPVELVELLQQYIDGGYIYIPRKKENKITWGTNTTLRKELKQRNICIVDDYKNGITINELSEQYYLSIKSIQRILLTEKKQIID